MTDRLLTIADAAAWAGAAARTIRRRLHDGRFPNAVRQGTTASAPWLIPLADLEAAGFRPTTTGAQAQVVEVVTPDPTAELRVQLAEALAQLAVATAQVAELRDRVEADGRTVTQMVEAVRAQAELLAASQAPTRRSRWRRRNDAPPAGN